MSYMNMTNDEQKKHVDALIRLEAEVAKLLDWPRPVTKDEVAECVEWWRERCEDNVGFAGYCSDQTRQDLLNIGSVGEEGFQVLVKEAVAHVEGHLDFMNAY
jgi:hypothetical protein